MEQKKERSVSEKKKKGTKKKKKKQLVQTAFHIRTHSNENTKKINENTKTFCEKFKPFMKRSQINLIIIHLYRKHRHFLLTLQPQFKIY